MDKRLILLPLLLVAAPAVAGPTSLPPELTDPSTGQRLTRTIQVMSKALLDLRVGELQAATEGREATPSEKKLTVRDIERRKDPNFDRNFNQRVAKVGPAVESGIKAVNDAMPSVMQALQQASDAIERAAANMPDPTYPKR